MSAGSIRLVVHCEVNRCLLFLCRNASGLIVGAWSKAKVDLLAVLEHSFRDVSRVARDRLQIVVSN